MNVYWHWCCARAQPWTFGYGFRWVRFDVLPWYLVWVNDYSESDNKPHCLAKSSSFVSYHKRLMKVGGRSTSRSKIDVSYDEKKRGKHRANKGYDKRRKQHVHITDEQQCGMYMFWLCAVYSKYSRIYGNVQGWRFHVNMYLVVYTLVPFDNAQLKPRAWIATAVGEKELKINYNTNVFFGPNIALTTWLALLCSSSQPVEGVYPHWPSGQTSCLVTGLVPSPPRYLRPVVR